VTKRIWAYIKGNGLQNPEDKRQILCDDKLERVLGVKKVDMFRLTKLLAQVAQQPRLVFTLPAPESRPH
jgi:upstream activation factor subunit UAF30